MGLKVVHAKTVFKLCSTRVSDFSCCSEISDESHTRKEGFILAHGSARYLVHHDVRSMMQLVISHPQSGGREQIESRARL